MPPKKNEDDKKTVGAKRRRSPGSGRVIALFRQFGGRHGNDAGDAAYFSISGSRRLLLIDGGAKTKGRRQNIAKEFRDKINSNNEITDADSEGEDGSDDEYARNIGRDYRYIGVNTHPHKDHTFKRATMEILHLIISGELVDPQIASITKKTLAKQKLDHHGVTSLLHWRNNVRVLSDGRLMSFKIKLIKPYAGEFTSKDNKNDWSLGFLFTVNIGNNRIFTFYSLGDMTHVGQSALKEAFKDDNKRKPDLIKLPHHGSLGNLSLLFEEFISEKTKIITSGWTNSDVQKIIWAWENLNIDPRNVTILFDDVRHDAPKAFGSSDINNDNVQLLDAAGVSFANWMEIRFGEDIDEEDVAEDLSENTANHNSNNHSNNNTYNNSNNNSQASNVVSRRSAKKYHHIHFEPDMYWRGKRRELKLQWAQAKINKISENSVFSMAAKNDTLLSKKSKKNSNSNNNSNNNSQSMDAGENYLGSKDSKEREFENLMSTMFSSNSKPKSFDSDGNSNSNSKPRSLNNNSRSSSSNLENASTKKQKSVEMTNITKMMTERPSSNSNASSSAFSSKAGKINTRSREKNVPNNNSQAFETDGVKRAEEPFMDDG